MRNSLTLPLLLPFLALSAATPVSCQAGSPNSTIPTRFNPPTLTPFIHIDQLTNLPVNVSTIYGMTARYENRGGNVTGAITGTIVNIGAAYEVIPPAGAGAIGFYTNTFTINTTEATLLMDARATISYANNALHGFGTVSFSSDAAKYLDLNWRSFVVEFEANFFSGAAYLDVFELSSSGKRDGSETPALPGSGAAPSQ
ncbi:hypothetical protein CC80DRAFT_556347 [Byssothecium circinans]|uniref:Uncharacterized protein n=1 Tax=Byssothecium circinans TaxID=147558 RepID=A0A6A5TC95_9PLEO|nr:hypothetical protein CC80DRAFT_556347 [Byssothecium circinans]